MDVNLSLMKKLKLAFKFINHKILQHYLATNETININTTCGPIKGIKRKNVYNHAGTYVAFEGIPYAKPPVGQLRFRSPEKPDPWSETLDCTTYRSKPVQHNFILGFAEGSEDCLYLNVYTRKLNSSKPLPVMVWFYGGAFMMGEASRDLYAPDYLMTKDVVVVTFNYRVGPLGFLSFADPDLNIPGNAGLKDQVLALHWIKENIHNFNGDPNNVTVFGESAGAASIHILMLAEPARGLFHKAILQSGSALCPWANSYLKDGNYRLALQLGYTGTNTDKSLYEFFMKLKAKCFGIGLTLFTKQEQLEQYLCMFGPVNEPYALSDSLIRKPFKDLLPTAWGNDIPILIGGTSFEGLLYYTPTVFRLHILNDLPKVDFVTALTPDLRNSYSEPELKEMGAKLRLAYFGDKEVNTKESLYEYLDLMSYHGFWHGIHRTILARCAYAPNSHTFCYRFDMDSRHFNHFRITKSGPHIRGVSHADDISYLFYNVAAEKLPPESDEYKTIQNMLTIWYAFAMNSNPDCFNLKGIKWEPIKMGESADKKPYKCVNIKDDLDYMELPEYKKLKIWDSFYRRTDLI